MKEILQKYLNILRKDRTRRRQLVGALCAVSLCVVLAVSWQLRFVGVAKSDEACCGKEEHEHTEECYELKLICGYEEGQLETVPAPSEPAAPSTQPTLPQVEAHTHGPECYEQKQTLDCQLAEHTHTDACYHIEKTLECQKPEHTHTEACYEMREVITCTEDHEHTEDCPREMQKVLICDQEEHTHTDDCYHIEKTLICEIPEHTHTEECYHTEQILICEKPEISEEDAAAQNEEIAAKNAEIEAQNQQQTESRPAEAPTQGGEQKKHVHTDACYEKVLICGKEEHKHTAECYIDPEADVETHEFWESTIPEELGETWGQRVFTVAQSQLGYHESVRNYKLSEDGLTQKGYTRYGAWYGNPYGDWSVMFTSFCQHYAGIPAEVLPVHSGAYALSVELAENELLEAPGYRPQKGDILFITQEGQENPNRTAVVTGIASDKQGEETIEYVTVIEGDLKDEVGPNQYKLTDPQIAGYISMDHAYQWAKGNNLLPEDKPEEELLNDELDKQLAENLKAFRKAGLNLEKAQKAEDDEAILAAKQEMDVLYETLKAQHHQRYPEVLEIAFTAYMKSNCEKAFELYLQVKDLLPGADVGQIPDVSVPQEAEGLKEEVQKAVDAFVEKAEQYSSASQQKKNKNKKLNQITEELNVLYKQAETQYLAQYPEGDFASYMKETYPDAMAQYALAEERTGMRTLDAMLQSKLDEFAELAKSCAIAMDQGNRKEAETLKLQLDQLYNEMKVLHAKRFPDAPDGEYDIYLNNNRAKAVKRYLAAVKAFADVTLDNSILYTDPITGEVRRIFKFADGMEMDVSVSGTVCFPIEQTLDEPVDQEQETSNLETVASDGAVVESTAGETAHPEAALFALDPAQEESAEAASETSTEESTDAPAEEPTEASSEESTEESAETVPQETENPDEGIMTTEEPVLKTAGEKMWEQVEVQVKPSAKKTEQAFARYVAENYPDAAALTVMDLDYLYQGKRLNLGSAEITVELTPGKNLLEIAPAAVTLSLNAEEAAVGPVIQKPELVESVSPAGAAADAMAQAVPDALPATSEQVAEAARDQRDELASQLDSAYTDPQNMAAPAAETAENPDEGIMTLEEPVLDESNPDDGIMTLEEPVEEDVPAASEPTEESSEDQIEFVVLERNSKGEIRVAATAKAPRSAASTTKISCQTGADVKNVALIPVTYAGTVPPDVDKRPIANHAQWPEYWNKTITSGAVNADGTPILDDSGVKKPFILRNDPYFVGKGEADLNKEGKLGVDRFEIPSTKVGYIMRNYNAFVFNDMVVKHVVGSVACGGTAYYAQTQGGTGGGYNIIENYAPNYFNGMLYGFNESAYTDPTSDKMPTAFNKTMIKLNQEDKRMPSYFSTTNIGNKYITNLTDGERGACSNMFPAEENAPYYFVDNYIDFEAFRTRAQEQTAALKTFKVPMDDKIAKLDTHGYQWETGGSGQKLLFLKMGYYYEVPDLTNVQIVLVKPDGYEFKNKDEQINDASRPENGLNARAVELSLLGYDTPIICPKTGRVDMFFKNKYGGIENTIAYWTKDSGKPVDANNLHDVTLGNVKGYTNSVVLGFPNADRVQVAKMEGHIVAPKATVEVQKGDYYGCIIADNLHAVGDIHVLPYGGQGNPEPPKPPYPFVKQIERDGVMMDPTDTPEETFSFTIRPVGLEPQTKEVLNAERTYTAFEPFTTDVHWTDKNIKEQIPFTAFLNEILMKQGDFKNHSIYQAARGYKGFGRYIFEVTEDDFADKEFVKDDTVYYLEWAYGYDRSNDWYKYPANWGQVDTVFYSKRAFTLPEGVTLETMADADKQYVTNDKVVFVNTLDLGGPELPHTGGIGVLPTTVVGLAFTILPLYLGKKSRRKERR